MTRSHRGTAFLASVVILLAAYTAVIAQPRSSVSRPPTPGAGGGGSESTERFISAVVYASWLQHWRASDGDTRSLLILWRGSPGWFMRRPAGGGGGNSSSGGGGGSSGWQTFSAGGLSFELDYDFDRNVVKMLNQDVSLVESNVVLVDFVDGRGGAQIVDRLWIEPPERQPPMPDPIFAIVKSSPRLYEYVRCDVSMPEANSYISDIMSMYCGQMRPQ